MLVIFMDIWMVIYWCLLRYMMFWWRYWKCKRIKRLVIKYWFLFLMLLLDLCGRKKTYYAIWWILFDSKIFEILWFHYSLCFSYTSLRFCQSNGILIFRVFMMILKIGLFHWNKRLIHFSSNETSCSRKILIIITHCIMKHIREGHLLLWII